MLNFRNKSKKFISVIRKNVASYMSSLPTKTDSKKVEDYIKDSLLSAFKIEPNLKSILENEDTQDDAIKNLNALRYALEKEMKIELSNKGNYIVNFGTLDYLKKQGFQIVDEPLEPIITLSKRIGDDYLVEICARACERDFKEDETTKERFVQELDDLTKKVELEQSKGSGYFLPREQTALVKNFVNSLLSSDNPFGVKQTPPFLFNVIITDLLLNQGLKFFCVFQENEIMVTTIEIVPDSFKLKEAAKKLVFQSINNHLTQNFLTLSDKFQKCFVDYIQSFGITTYVCLHLEYLSFFKEEINYLNWMKEINRHCLKLFEEKLKKK